MGARNRIFKSAAIMAAMMLSLVPAVTVRAGENGPFVQPAYAPIIYSGVGSPLSSPYAVQPTVVKPGPGIVVPNATNTGYVNPLIPPQNLPRTPLRPNTVVPQPVSNPLSSNPTTNAVPPATVSVSFPSGWAMVSGPTGTVISGNTGSLYTFGPSDTAYEMLSAGSPLTAGAGYWAYFAAPSTGSIPLASGQSVTVQVPAGHFVMIGNPGSGTATVTGADSVLVYNAASGQFQQSTTLAPGQGGWAWSANGSTVTIQSS